MPLQRRAARRAFVLKSAHAWVQTAQRTARYSYRKVMAHLTNPDHYEASPVSAGSSPLKLAARYATGRPRRGQGGRLWAR
jgi:hypothetical protein